MTVAQDVWAVLIAAQAVVILPLLINLFRGDKTPMPIPDDIQAQLDRIEAATGKIQAKVDAAVEAATADAAQTKADILDGVTKAADAVETAVG